MKFLFLLFHIPLYFFSQSKGYTGGRIIINPKDNFKYEIIGKDTMLVVDKLPEFKGGQVGLINFLKSNVIYPEGAIRDSISGIVILRFTITAKGEVSKISVLKSVRDDLDSSAIETVAKMPKWNPGYQGDIAVPVVYNLPINFIRNPK
ncbi:MAG: energy transducer TonB [Bacteroidetes bacterium]|nr:energy transducer TonB [Bacteroidota bacterium]